MDKEDTSVPDPLQVILFDAKPNTMFSDAQTRTIRFLKYNQRVRCAECGKRSTTHWTALYSFTASRIVPGAFTLQESGTVHLPLTPVCRTHPLAPAPWDGAPETRRRAVTAAPAPGGESHA